MHKRWVQCKRYCVKAVHLLTRHGAYVVSHLGMFQKRLLTNEMVCELTANLELRLTEGSISSL